MHVSTIEMPGTSVEHKAENKPMMPLSKPIAMTRAFRLIRQL